MTHCSDVGCRGPLSVTDRGGVFAHCLIYVSDGWRVQQKQVSSCFVVRKVIIAEGPTHPRVCM